MQESGKNQASDSDPKSESKPMGKTSSKPEKRQLNIWRRMFRFILIMLIIFGFGAITVIFTLYIPQREQLNRAQSRIEDLNSQKESDLQAANEEIDRLTSIEDQFDASQSQLGQLQLQNLVLKIKLDVMKAKMALLSDDPEEASQVLSGTAGRIADLEELVGIKGKRNIDNLETRLDLVLSEIEEDTFAALSDLEVMLDILADLDQ